MKVIDLLEMRDLPDAIAYKMERRAEAERDAGGTIEIDPVLPSIAVKLSDGSEYFFQEWEADEILGKVPGGIEPEDYILAQAQNW